MVESTKAADIQQKCWFLSERRDHAVHSKIPSPLQLLMLRLIRPAFFRDLRLKRNGYLSGCLTPAFSLRQSKNTIIDRIE
jgi:hypothetical protein